jgi:hypothetical protein
MKRRFALALTALALASAIAAPAAQAGRKIKSPTVARAAR